MLAQGTEVEDVQVNPRKEVARINPECIEMYHKFTDESVLVLTTGGLEIEVHLTLEEFDTLLDTHEITIYEN